MDENKVITIEEANKRMEELGKFANACYNKGVNDALICVGIGAAVGVIACGISAILIAIVEKRSKKTETEI